MLKHPTLDLLHQLGLAGMAQAFAELAANDEFGQEFASEFDDDEKSKRGDRDTGMRVKLADISTGNTNFIEKNNIER